MSVDNRYIEKLECFLRGVSKDRKDFIDLYDLFIKPLKNQQEEASPMDLIDFYREERKMRLNQYE